MAEQSFKLKNSQTGNYWKIQNGKRVYFNKEGKQIDEAIFLKDENAKINKDGKIESNKIYIKGSKSGRYYTIENGVRKYYAADGTELKESYFFEKEGVKKNEKGQLEKTGSNNIQIKSARNIAENLKKATKGWNDNDAIKSEMSKVDNAEELAELEKQLSAAGYKADDMYSSVEKFLYKELSDSSAFDNSFDYLEELVQKWIQNGTLKGDAAIKAQARLAARIIRDGGDGMGTDCDEIKRGIHLIKNPKTTGNIAQDEANAKKVYQEVQKIIKNAHGETLEEYLDGEMWDGEVKYLRGIMAQNSAVQGKTKQQAIVDLIKEAVEGAGTNVDELKQALKGIASEKDRKAINAILVKYCENKGIKGQIQGQQALQAIMYDELDGFAGIGTNHEEIRKFNEMLISQGAYTEDEATSLRAEQAALQILEGDMDNIKDALENINDKAVLKALNSLLTTKGYKNIDDYLAKAGKSQEDKDIANSILAKKNMLNNKQAAEVAARLLLNDDFDTQANGVRAITNSEVAKLVDEELKKSNTTLAKVMETFNKEKNEYKFQATLYNSSLGILNEYISNQYEENTDISDNLYVESETAQNISEEDKEKYNAVIDKLESDLNKLKEDYQAALDTQGVVSAGVDYIAASFNLGTNRKDIEARISEEEESLRLYKLASEGKLSKIVDGKVVPVSFEEIFKERQSNTEYKTQEVDAVTKQAERMVAMNMTKDIISTSWSELNHGLKTKEENALTVAVYNGIEALSKLNPEITLEKMGLSFDGTNIVDASGNKLSIEKLTEIANSLKQDYSNISKEVFNKDIPADSNNEEILETLNDGYDSQLENFKEEYKKAFGKEPTDEMLEDYLTTVNTGVMVVNIGAAIGATILTAGYGSLAIFAAVGTTSAALNTLEHSTDANGLTNSELTADLEQAAWDGALGAIGVKVGKYAELFKGNSEIFAKQLNFIQKTTNLSEKSATKLANYMTKIEAIGGEFTSDTIQSIVQQYAMDGEIDFADEGFIRAMLMSAGFNTVGHVFGKIEFSENNKTVKDFKSNIKADLAADAQKTKELIAGNPVKGKTDAATTENSYQLNKVEEKEVSPEFKQGMSQLEDAVKSESGNTIGEMINNNPWFAQFKDQLEGLEDYTIVTLDDATRTARGSHTASKKVGRQIALNINALKHNEEAFVNTLMHEAEHARQHKKYTTLQFKKDKTAEDLKYIAAYRAMDKANKARQEFYNAHSKEINQFVEDIQGKSVEEIAEILSKYDDSQQEVCQKYMKLYNEYKNSALEVEARDAGTKAVETYNKNKEVNNGQEDRGSNPVREGDTAGDSDRSVGSGTRNESIEQGPKGTDGRQETKVEPDAPVKTDATSNPEVVTPARAEGSIENGTIFFNGEEFDIPKTADEAKAFADSQGDNIETHKFGDGSTNLYFYNQNKKAIAYVSYNKNGNIETFLENTFDKQGKELKTTFKNPDGSINFITENIYTPDGNPNGTIFRKANEELNFYRTNNDEKYKYNKKTKQFELKDDKGNVVKYGVYDEANNSFTTSDKPFPIEAETPAPKADDVKPEQPVETADTGKAVEIERKPENQFVVTNTNENYFGFKRNKDAITDVTNLTENDIVIEGTFAGFSTIFGKSLNKADIRIIPSTKTGKPIVIGYNKRNNSTLIVLRFNDAFGRPGGLSIQIKGQISETDAINLLYKLQDEKLLYSGANAIEKDFNSYGYWGKKVAASTIDYFNNLAKQADDANNINPVKVEPDAPAKPVETGKVEAETAKPENQITPRGEDSIENSKIFFNGREIEIPKTADEAREFAKNNEKVYIEEAFDGSFYLQFSKNSHIANDIITEIHYKDNKIVDISNYEYGQDGLRKKAIVQSNDGNSSIKYFLHDNDGFITRTIETDSNGNILKYNNEGKDIAPKEAPSIEDIESYNGIDPSTKVTPEQPAESVDITHTHDVTNSQRIIIDPNEVTPTPEARIIVPDGVTPTPEARIIVPDEVTPTPEARIIVPDEVTPTPEARIIVPDEVQGNNIELIKPEDSPQPKEVIKIEEPSPKVDDVKPEQPAETGKVEAETPNAENHVTPRGEGSINDGKVFFNGQEFDIPKTADEAKAFADSQGNNVTIYPYNDGSIDLEFRNEQNKIIVEIRYNNKGEVTSSNEYKYNENGKKISKIQKDAEGNFTEYNYDGNGNEISKIYKDANGKVKTSEEYNYDENGHLRSAIYNNGEGKVTTSEEYNYNENGNLRSVIYKDSEGKVTTSEEYNYNENGNLRSVIYKDSEGKVTFSEEYNYDENGKKISKIQKDAEGNVAEYNYDENGHWTSVIHKDANGNPTKYEVNENGEIVEKPVSEIPTQQNHNNPHVKTKTKKDGTTIETTKYGDDKKVVTRDKDNNVIRTELYHKGKQVSAEYIDKNGNMVYETYADGELIKKTGIDKNGNNYIKKYNGTKLTIEYTKPGATKPFKIDTYNDTLINYKIETSKIYSDDGNTLKQVKNYNSKGKISNVDIYTDDGLQIKRHEEYYKDFPIAITYDNGQPALLNTYTKNQDGDWVIKDTYSYNSTSKEFELKDADGNILATATYEPDAHRFTETETDKKPKVYENNTESSHKVRNGLIGTAAVAGIGYGVYEATNSDASNNEANKANLTEVTEETQPETSEETEPEVTEETQPETSEETEPEVTEETQPETSEEIEPEVTEETQPETSEETEPEVTEETQPETSEETEPEVTEETQPETSVETEPEKKKESTPTNPAETTPETKPVVTPTNPVETTPETKPVVTPTNPVETTPETKPVVTPTNPVETTPDVKPVDETPQEEKTRVKPTIKESDLVNGRDPETGKKREITPIERMEITKQIEQAKNEEDLKLIQEEMRSFKVFKGRKNLRKALKAKRKMFKKPESDRRQDKYENRMDKIENSKVYQEDLIKTQYDYVEPEEKRFDDLDNPFFA